MLTDSIDSHPALSSPRKLTKDAQHCTNQRPPWEYIDQWEGRKLSQEAGQYRGAILRKYRHQRGLGPDVTHNGINIAPQSTSSDQDTTENRERLLWILYLKLISWYAFATIDPRSRQNSLMFCNASPRAMEPSDKIYTSLPLSMLEAKPSCLSQKWGPDKINVSLSGSFSFMEYDEGF